MPTFFLIGLAICVVAFAATWWVCVRIKNYSFLDVAFSYGVAVLAPLYLLGAPGPPAKAWAAAAAGLIWSLRLGTYILLRVLRHHPEEDVRYATLREKWPGAGMFLVFFEMQAVLVAIFSLPFLVLAFDPNPTPGPWTIAGIALALSSISGEALADAQMRRFKADPASKGQVCHVGLWNYSRHPNYFFESMVWWGFFLAAVGSPYGWITIICPLLMFYFLFQVTGIPLTEQYALNSKGDAYREYQRTTSAFVPWFRRS